MIPRYLHLMSNERRFFFDLILLARYLLLKTENTNQIIGIQDYVSPD